MRVATPEERDILLRIDEDLLDHLRQMSREHAGAEDMAAVLRKAGVPKPAASIALRRAGVMDLVVARNAIASSLAYACWPEPDEAYPASSVSLPPGKRVSEAA